MKAVISLLKSIFAREYILEEFDCWITDTDAETSTFRMASRVNGDVLYGVKAVSELKRLGVDHRFVCRTIGRGEWTRLDIVPVADREITDEEAREIRESIERDIPLISDDY